jgi:mannose-6-phosphate isomerase-like protein (cupin superfamily)
MRNDLPKANEMVRGTISSDECREPRERLRCKAPLLAIALLLMPLPALAQPAPSPTKLFTAGADIPALIAKAKAEQKSPTINSVQQIASDGPYRVLLEYRTGLTPPTVHHGLAELIHVIQGSATLVTGGHLTGIVPGRPGSTTDSGTGIEGASPQKLTAGDYVVVPADTAHQFQDVQGEFIIMSVHMFMPPAK